MRCVVLLQNNDFFLISAHILPVQTLRQISFLALSHLLPRAGMVKFLPMFSSHSFDTETWQRSLVFLASLL